MSARPATLDSVLDLRALGVHRRRELVRRLPRFLPGLRLRRTERANVVAEGVRGRADVLRRRLTTAGLKDVRIERTAERPTFGSGLEMWNWVLYGNPIPGLLVADLSQDQRARLRQVLDGMLRERAGANGQTTLTNAVNVGIGTKRRA